VHFYPVSDILTIFAAEQTPQTTSISIMNEKKVTVAKQDTESKEPQKRTNKTVEAARRLKGSLIVNDPTFLL